MQAKSARFWENTITGTDWIALSQGPVDDLQGPPFNFDYDVASGFKDKSTVFVDNFNAAPPLPLPGQTTPQVSMDVQLDRLVDVLPPSVFQAEITGDDGPIEHGTS